MLIPTVIDKTANGERSYDIYSRLLEDRIVFVTGEINESSANTVIAQLLYLESKDQKKEINIYINSPGGLALSGFAIIDTIRYIKCPVATNCLGLAASAAALVLAAGQAGRRFILPNSKVMIHQPWGGVKGQITEIEIYYKEGIKDRQKYAEILAECCGKNVKTVLLDIERDNYMSGAEAVKYGIADKILVSEKEAQVLVNEKATNEKKLVKTKAKKQLR
ncbi:MAG: ATP-dependent Clp protease proteolytic subunit [Firmicutes bacterium]|nr:ATP-dependent Clp protease proteolytic subunit [Bacillota bacterium]